MSSGKIPPSRFSSIILDAMATFLETNREFVRWTQVNDCWRHALMRKGDLGDEVSINLGLDDLVLCTNVPRRSNYAPPRFSIFRSLI